MPISESATSLAARFSISSERIPMRRPIPGSRQRTKWLAPKVPEITLIFWVIKLLTTGIGETVSDAMGQRNVPVAGAVGVLGVRARAARTVANRSLPRAALLDVRPDAGGL